MLDEGTPRVMGGDEYSGSERMEQTEVLKMGTEGDELKILEGFEGLLGRAFISVTQLRYGSFCIPSRVTPEDFYEDLHHTLGCVVGRLFPIRIRSRKMAC
jgi:hypothetical protein